MPFGPPRRYPRLLRSGQKGIGDLLRYSRELVLEFTIAVGELHRGRLEEYQAA